VTDTALQAAVPNPCQNTSATVTLGVDWALYATPDQYSSD